MLYCSGLWDRNWEKKRRSYIVPSTTIPRAAVRWDLTWILFLIDSFLNCNTLPFAHLYPMRKISILHNMLSIKKNNYIIIPLRQLIHCPTLSKIKWWRYFLILSWPVFVSDTLTQKLRKKYSWKLHSSSFAMKGTEVLTLWVL